MARLIYILIIKLVYCLCCLFDKKDVCLVSDCSGSNKQPERTNYDIIQDHPSMSLSIMLRWLWLILLCCILQIAEHCIEHHNYSTGMSLVSGLRCSSVSRLAKTWRGISRKDAAAWENLTEIFDAQNNFSAYRRQMHQAIGEPALPYIGVVLQDLLMVEELPTFMPNKMVNFRKMRRFATLLKEEIQNKQIAAGTRYNFEVDHVVQEYFSNFAPLLDADLYKWSRMCEPAALA